MNLEIPNKLEINIDGIIKEMKEKLRKQEKCRKLGHPGEESNWFYFRSSTFEEVMEFDEMMNTPMTL